VVGAFVSIREYFQQPLPEEHVLFCDLVTAHQEEAGRLRELYDRCPQAKLLIFNVLDDDETIAECVRVGASGCILPATASVKSWSSGSVTLRILSPAWSASAQGPPAGTM
jgi:DNA-binding NarL/FixJ family response regulator